MLDRILSFIADLLEDSGWKSLGSYTIYRKKAGILYCRVENIPKTSLSGTVIATLPTGYRPSQAFSLVARTNNGQSISAWVTTGGTINVNNGQITNGTLIALSFAFPL